MKKEKDATILWWMGWITLTVATFFVAGWFWTGFIADHYGPMSRPGAPLLWVTAVFGSWMVLLVPLIILMYNKVDKAYEDARIARETSAFNKAKETFKIKSVLVEENDRRLGRTITEKLKKMPEAVRRGHLVTALLKNGRRVENVFVLDKKWLLGVYGEDHPTFQAVDISDVEPTDLDRLPDFKASEWLRLDGVGTQA